MRHGNILSLVACDLKPLTSTSADQLPHRKSRHLATQGPIYSQGVGALGARAPLLLAEPTQQLMGSTSSKIAQRRTFNNIIIELKIKRSKVNVPGRCHVSRV